MITDPIADFLIRVKNGYLAKKREIIVPYSKIKEKLAKILVDEGYLETSKVDKEKRKVLELVLKYHGKKPAMTDVQRVSKLGLRIYARKTEIPKALGGSGIVIISTSKGLMTDKQAKENGLGGEVLCKVW